MAYRFIWALVVCCIETAEGGVELTPCQQWLWDNPYTGNVSVTDLGYECQDWASQFPWRHKYTKDEMFPYDGGVKEAKNYCRNIDNPIIPWCYTNDWVRIWDFCYLPICSPLKTCGETQKAPSGRISSPDEDNDGNYETLIFCHWTIEVEASYIIEFHIPLLDIEESTECHRDRLQIYEPQAHIMRICTLLNSITVTTEGNILHVEFYSDDENVNFGFELTYEQKEPPHCGGIIRRESGIFQPLDFDSDGFYDANLNCSWYLVGGYYKLVRVVIPEIDIEESEFCEKDYIQVFDYAYKLFEYRNLSEKICGDSISINITSATDLFIVFASDSDGQGRGFTASFEQLISPHDCWRGVPHKQYAGTLNVSDTGRICQPWSAQGPHEHPWTNEKLFPRDGSVIEARNYCRDPVGTGLPFCLTIDEEMKIDSCVRRICEGDQDCFDTDVKMTYTGTVATTNHGLTCAPWSDHLSGDAFHFDDKSAVKARNYCRAIAGDRTPWCFTTDPNVPWDYCNIRICRGYDLQCGGKIEDVSGWFAAPDTDGDGLYDNYAVCMWFFETLGKTLTFLTFEYLDIHHHLGNCEDRDYLTIFADGTHVATLCGSHTPDMLTLPAYSTIVKFVSDSIFSGRGFNITYKIIRTDITETELPQTAIKTDTKETTVPLPRTTNSKPLHPLTESSETTAAVNMATKSTTERESIPTSTLPGTTTRKPLPPEYTLPSNYGSSTTVPTLTKPVVIITKTESNIGTSASATKSTTEGESIPTSTLPGTTTRKSNMGASASATKSTTEEDIGKDSSQIPSSTGIRINIYHASLILYVLAVVAVFVVTVDI